VTEYRFEVRIERVPSCELMVFCRVTGCMEEPEAEDVREGVCSIETAMLPYMLPNVGMRQSRSRAIPLSPT